MTIRITSFPVEVLRAVLKEACGVPEAFEYPFIEPELQEMRVSGLIKDSMATKLSISLVSKLFHGLVEEYLYEIIYVRSFNHIRPLVSMLRLPCIMNTAVTKGWWCRRLEVDLKVNKGQWAWGCISLWGLATSCLRLVDLRCSLEHGPSHITGPQPNYLVSLTLAQLLASQCGCSIRHLRLGGFVTISVGLMNRLLSHMTALEVCRLSHLQPVSDEEIEKVISISLLDGEADSRTSISAVKDEGWEYGDGNIPRLPRYCKDDRENDEYLDVVRRACWPSATGRAVDLPRLRDLRMSPFLSLVGGWKLPRLRSVTDSLLPYRWDDHDHNHALLKGLRPHSQSITHFTFRGDSTAMAGVWELVGRLSSLQHLRITTMYGWHGALLNEPHHGLRFITLFCGRTKSTAIAEAMDNIFVQAEEQKLPKLKALKVWGTDGIHLVEERRARCELLSLSLEVRDVEWSAASE